MRGFLASAHRYLRQWCRAMGRAYLRWENRPYPFGDGI
jgi:hypothetical protein